MWKALREESSVARESADSKPVVLQVQATLTRQECANFDMNRNELGKFASLLLCQWRFVNYSNDDEKLFGNVELYPTCMRLILYDFRTEEEQEEMCGTKVKMPRMAEFGNLPASPPDVELSPGRPDFVFPLRFAIQHRKRKQDDEIEHQTEFTLVRSPPEDTFSACVDLIKELYAMAGQYLDTLEAMERQLPHRMEEFRRKRESAKEDSKETDSFDPGGFITVLSEMNDFEALMEEIGYDFMEDLGWKSSNIGPDSLPGNPYGVMVGSLGRPL
jgi:hypothetical protein